MSKQQQQTSLFPSTTPAKPTKSTRRRYTYYMAHPNDPEQVITSKSLDAAYNELIGAYFYDSEEEEKPSRKEFKDQIKELGYFEVTEFLYVSRS